MAVVVSNLVQSSKFVQPVRPSIPTAAATTLTLDRSGSVVLPDKTVAHTITLPSPLTPGLYFTVIGQGTGQIVTIDSSGAGLMNAIAIHNTTVALIANKACRNIRFLAGSVDGDKVELVSDGQQWNAVGTGGFAGASFDMT